MHCLGRAGVGQLEGASSKKASRQGLHTLAAGSGQLQQSVAGLSPLSARPGRDPWGSLVSASGRPQEALPLMDPPGPALSCIIQNTWMQRAG